MRTESQLVQLCIVHYISKVTFVFVFVFLTLDVGERICNLCFAFSVSYNNGVFGSVLPVHLEVIV